MRAVVNVRTRLESVSVGVSRRKYLKICMYADMLARMYAHVEAPDQPISRQYELICIVNLAFTPEAHIIQQLRRVCWKRRERLSAQTDSNLKIQYRTDTSYKSQWGTYFVKVILPCKLGLCQSALYIYFFRTCCEAALRCHVLVLLDRFVFFGFLVVAKD